MYKMPSDTGGGGGCTVSSALVRLSQNILFTIYAEMVSFCYDVWKTIGATDG